jgi:hypothetical protein
VVNFFSAVPRAILHALGIKSPPQWAIDAGKHIMTGIGIGVSFAKGVVSKATAAQIQNATLGAFGAPGGGAIGPSAAAAQTWMHGHMADYGWGLGQWPALQALWNHESGWRWDAQNPSSPAYGIPQADPGSKMAAAGGDWRTNPVTQMRWGAEYIRGVYGNPSNAWAFEMSHFPNWYGSGTSSARAGWAVVGERGPELMKLRGGEQIAPVRPAQVMPRGRDSAPVRLQIEWVGGNGGDGLMKWIRENVRVHGGGDVQKAYGRR